LTETPPLAPDHQSSDTTGLARVTPLLLLVVPAIGSLRGWAGRSSLCRGANPACMVMWLRARRSSTLGEVWMVLGCESDEIMARTDLGRIRGGSTRPGLPTRLLVGVNAERVVDRMRPRRCWAGV